MTAIETKEPCRECDRLRAIGIQNALEAGASAIEKLNRFHDVAKAEVARVEAERDAAVSMRDAANTKAERLQSECNAQLAVAKRYADDLALRLEAANLASPPPASDDVRERQGDEVSAPVFVGKVELRQLGKAGSLIWQSEDKRFYIMRDMDNERLWHGAAEFARGSVLLNVEARSLQRCADLMTETLRMTAGAIQKDVLDADAGDKGTK